MLQITTSTHDPAFNLALEERLLYSLPENHPGYFLLWQNSPSIIVGRHQCAMAEIRPFMARDLGIPVFRRITGGGAVYHDLGNLNFSFICHRRGNMDFGEFLEPVCRALAALGVAARITGRNDIEAGGRKISGSGQLRLRDRILHHGTLLINADLEKMGKLLTPGEHKILSKGVASVAGRVGNIAEIRPDLDIAQLRDALAAACAPEKGELAEEDLAAARELARQKYGSHDWNFGSVPPCDLTRRKKFPFGEVVARISLNQAGRIAACRIEGDFFGSPALLAEKLAGVEFSCAAMRKALADLPWDELFYGCDPKEMLRFFAHLPA